MSSHVSTWIYKHSDIFNTYEAAATKRKTILRNKNLEDKMSSSSRHVDVSNLTDEECRKVINVISKDILIRKSEKDRIGYLNKRFDDLRRAILLSNSNMKKRLPFDDYCLICGKHLFTFLCFIQRGEECISCENFCCPSCRKGLVLETKTNINGQSKKEYFYICKLCIQKKEIKGRTADWFYEAVEKRFKRFGSAKALRAIYKQRKTIEPRVITLLALCRELQPSRKISYTALRRKISMSKPRTEDSSFGGYASSFSDFDVKETEITMHRRRNRSESEVDRSKPINIQRTNSLSHGKHSSSQIRHSYSLDELVRPTSSKEGTPVEDSASILKLTIEEEDYRNSPYTQVKKTKRGDDSAKIRIELVEKKF